MTRQEVGKTSQEKCREGAEVKDRVTGECSHLFTKSNGPESGEGGEVKSRNPALGGKGIHTTGAGGSGGREGSGRSAQTSACRS